MRCNLLRRSVGVTVVFCSLSSSALHSQQPSSNIAPKNEAVPAVTSTAVTTPGGTAGLMPIFTGTSTIGNSIIYQTANGIGIGRFPNATLDIGGTSTFRGSMGISRAGDATTAAGVKSFPILMQSSVYNSSLKKNVLPYFQLQTEPAGNNTASPGTTLNFLYYSGVGSAPAETGLYINGNGTIHFSPSQTFPITQGAQGPAGPRGPAGPSGTVGPNISVSGAISAGGGLTGNPTTSTGTAVTAIENGSIGTGVYAVANGTQGLAVEALGGEIGVYAYGTDYAGEFYGNVYVNGNLSKAGGSFKIDHPLDPENKYLSHSFVESPDMKNIYDGNVTTDATGTAVVTMPDYFEALNRDFRYQLTVVGEQFAQARVASKISNGTFIIKTDKPGVEISWQVTGIRQDAWANAHRIPTEEIKPEKERGHLLHPELFGRLNDPSIADRNRLIRVPTLSQ